MLRPWSVILRWNTAKHNRCTSHTLLQWRIMGLNTLSFIGYWVRSMVSHWSPTSEPEFDPGSVRARNETCLSPRFSAFSCHYRSSAPYPSSHLPSTLCRLRGGCFHNIHHLSLSLSISLTWVTIELHLKQHFKNVGIKTSKRLKLYVN